MSDYEHAFVFVDNHDNQRGHGGGGQVIVSTLQSFCSKEISREVSSWRFLSSIKHKIVTCVVENLHPQFWTVCIMYIVGNNYYHNNSRKCILISNIYSDSWTGGVVQVCPGFYFSSWLWNKENHVELLFWRFRSRTTRFFSWLWRSVGLWAPLEIHRYVRHEIICLTILENTYVIRTDLNLYTSSIVLRYYPVWNMGNNYWFFFIRFNILWACIFGVTSLIVTSLRVTSY